MDWLILYDDESRFSSLDGEAHEAPKSGVLMVFVADDTVDVQVEPSDAGYWIWKDGTWLGVDAAGYWDYRFHYMAPQTVIYGRMVRDDDWSTRVQALIKEEMGRDKNSWRKRERRP